MITAARTGYLTINRYRGLQTAEWSTLIGRDKSRYCALIGAGVVGVGLESCQTDLCLFYDGVTTATLSLALTCLVIY